jgi:hypothetical protein
LKPIKTKNRVLKYLNTPFFSVNALLEIVNMCMNPLWEKPILTARYSSKFSHNDNHLIIDQCGNCFTKTINKKQKILLFLGLHNLLKAKHMNTFDFNMYLNLIIFISVVKIHKSYEILQLTF